LIVDGSILNGGAGGGAGGANGAPTTYDLQQDGLLNILQTEVNTLAAMINNGNVNNNVTTLLDTLQADMIVVKASDNAQNTRLDALEAADSTLQGWLNNLQRQVNTWDAQQNTRLDALEAADSTLQNSVNALDSALLNSVNALEAADLTLTQRLSTLESAHVTDINNVVTNHNDLKNDMWATTYDLGNKITVVDRPLRGGGTDDVLIKSSNNDMEFRWGRVEWAATFTVAGSLTANEIFSQNNITAFYSDARLKQDLEVVRDAGSLLDKLNVYTYTWNEKGQQLTGFAAGEEDVGCVAQEVQAAFPKAVRINKAVEGEEYLSVDYVKMIPLLISEIQSLRQEVRELKQRI